MLTNLKTILSHYKDILYNKYYPPQIIFRNKQRRRLKNKDFCLITGNCIAGYLYHQLGLPFNSPTINMMIYNQHLKKMVFNLEYFLSKSPTKIIDPDLPNVPSANIDDVILHFTHYKTAEDGIKTWEKRKKRIDLKNIYILFSDIDLTKEEIKELGNVKCKKILVMTSRDYGFEHCLYIPEFKGQPHVGGLLGKTLSGKWEFEKYFDFVAWVNSDDKKAQNFYIGNKMKKL